MASHLTVTSTTAGINSSRGLASSAEAEGTGDTFAALLGATTPPPANDASGTSTSTPAPDADNTVNMSLGFGEEQAQENEDPEAIAAVIDAVIPAQDTPAAGPVLTNIAETLADLKARLEAGEPLDAETLNRLDAALTELAAALDIDLSALPSIDDLTALITDIQPDDTSLAARLTAAFGPVAETLFSGSAAPAGEAGAELSDLVKSIGDKLAALLAALNNGELDADKLAQLELDAQTNADLQASLAKLREPVLAEVIASAAPTLATPELKLPEATLTGKVETVADAEAPVDAAPETSETEEAPAATQPSANQGEQASDRRNDTPGQERKATEHRPASAAAGSVDKQPDAQTAPQPVPPAARADVVVGPRVVQAGYQTSQQQLNLPQLAFEVVRQVHAGNTRFQIRLDPPELGRIDVKLDIDQAGQVNARLTVEKSETLDLMQRDQRALERALQQAGLDGTKTNLEFSLKQNPFSGQGQDGGNGRNPIFGDEVTAEADETPPPTVNLYRGNLTARGVNIIA